MAVYVVAVGASLIVLNVVMCLAIVANPEAAASVFAGPANLPTVLLYRSVLAFGRYDSEADLNPGTPFAVLVQNCRRRAMRRLQLLLVGVVILVVVSASKGWPTLEVQFKTR